MSLAQVGRCDPQFRSRWTGIVPLAALGWPARSWARRARLWLETPLEEKAHRRPMASRQVNTIDAINERLGVPGTPSAPRPFAYLEGAGSGPRAYLRLIEASSQGSTGI